MTQLLRSTLWATLVIVVSSPVVAGNCPTLNLMEGRTYELLLEMRGTQTFSGVLPMTFEDESNRLYRITTVDTTGDGYELKATLARHWGEKSNSLSGRKTFDSNDPRVDDDVAWLISKTVGMQTVIVLDKSTLELAPLDAGSAIAAEAIEHLRFAFHCCGDFRVEEETLTGALSMACSSDPADDCNGRARTCGTGEIREVPSTSELRQRTAAHIVRLAGEPKLSEAEVSGRWVYAESPTLVDMTVTIGIQYVLGAGSTSEVNWEYSGSTEGHFGEAKSTP
jgi:hypothetical protein